MGLIYFEKMIMARLAASLKPIKKEELAPKSLMLGFISIVGCVGAAERKIRVRFVDGATCGQCPTTDSNEDAAGRSTGNRGQKWHGL